jgi:hypothetical protein
MAKSIAELMNELTPDPWRAKVGFSDDVEEANRHVFAASSNDQIIGVLNDWLSRHQPCLFGKIAARCGFLSHCVLTPEDLQGSDESIGNKIQSARTAWSRDGFNGQKSGFIISAISEPLAGATPDETMKAVALRLCSLYLLVDVQPDQIFQDEMFLQKPGKNPNTWRWLAGVNYFSAQGDKRWWQDHRLPGGMAFSINSVGHMVKSAILARAMQELEEKLNAPEEDWSLSKVESLDRAHALAMQTIFNASMGPSGKATELLASPSGATSGCPAGLPPALANKDCSQYVGRYHTDFTVPSEYFRPDVLRPADVESHVLDFTYLFRQGVENPDFVEMGEGRLIREDDAIAALFGVDFVPSIRMNKMVGHEVAIDECPRLKAALGQ